MPVVAIHGDLDAGPDDPRRWRVADDALEGLERHPISMSPRAARSVIF
jgi:hypothetical protein